jgi:hypothetical protein
MGGRKEKPHRFVRSNAMAKTGVGSTLQRSGRRRERKFLKKVPHRGLSAPVGPWKRTAKNLVTSCKARKMADLTVQPETRIERLAAVAARPLSELLECPQNAGSVLTGASRCLDFDAGQVIFRQQEAC